MSRCDDFTERLEAAHADGEGCEDFVEYLRGMTPGEPAELLAEAGGAHTSRSGKARVRRLQLSTE